jgi:hypothetical protein
MEEFPGPVFLRYVGKKHPFYLNTDSGMTTLSVPDFCLVFDPSSGDLIRWPAGTKITVRRESPPSISPEPVASPEHVHRRRRKKKPEIVVETTVVHRRAHRHHTEDSFDSPPPEVKHVHRRRHKSSPSVRLFSTHELFHAAFDLPINYDRQHLLDYLNSVLRIDTFAEAHFCKHTARGHRKAAIPIEELTSFASHALKKPLLKSVPTNLKRDVAHLSQCLLEATGVQRGGDASAATKKIVGTLREKPLLVDDFYFQLIKQTTNNPARNYLVPTWELFLVVATLFPAAEDLRRWIRGHITRAIMTADPQVAEIAALTYIRFDSRNRLGVARDVVPSAIDDIPKDVRTGTPAFRCSLYEMMFRQRITWPRLPIPRALHYIVLQLKAKGVFMTEGVFATSSHEGATDAIRAEANKNLAAIAAADLRTVANLLRLWLQDLPNPVVPIEATDAFQKNVEAGSGSSFVHELPPLHKRVLVYVVGFIRELIANAQRIKMGKSDFAFQFGTRLVNPQKHARGHAQNEETLTELSVTFFNQIVDTIDIAGIYPLPDELLVERSEQEVQEHFHKLSATGEPDDWLREDGSASPTDASNRLSKPLE